MLKRKKKEKRAVTMGTDTNINEVIPRKQKLTNCLREKRCRASKNKINWGHPYKHRIEKGKKV